MEAKNTENTVGLIINTKGKIEEFKSDEKVDSAVSKMMVELAVRAGFRPSKNLNAFFSVITAGNKYKIIEQNTSIKLTDTNCKLRLIFIFYIKTRPSDIANPIIDDFIFKNLDFTFPGIPVYGDVIIAKHNSKTDNYVCMKPEEIQTIRNIINVSKSLPEYSWDAPPGGPTKSTCKFVDANNEKE